MMHGRPNWIVPTPPAGDSSHRVADTEFVATAIANFSAFVATSIASSVITSFVASVTVGTGLLQTNTTGNVTVFTIFNATSASLGADQNMTTTTDYFNGPSVAQGTTGTWYASGSVTLLATAGSQFFAKLWDGTNIIDSIAGSSSGNVPVAISLSGFIASPAGNLRIDARCTTTTSGAIKFNTTGNSKDSTITAVRLA